MELHPNYLKQLDHLPENAWQRKGMDWLKDTLNPPTGRPLFPCIPAISGINSGHLPVSFISKSEDLHPRIFDQLSDFYEKSDTIPQHLRALLTFVEERSPKSSRQYQESFWEILNSLRETDPKPWPDGFTKDIHSPSFQYCFREKPVFISGFWQNHPHLSRRAYSPVGMVLVFGLPENVEPYKDDKDRRGEEGKFHKLVDKIRTRDDLYSQPTGGRLSVSQFLQQATDSQIYEYQGIPPEKDFEIPLKIN